MKQDIRVPAVSISLVKSVRLYNDGPINLQLAKL